MIFHTYVKLPEGNPIKPPFSYAFPMVFLWFSHGYLKDCTLQSIGPLVMGMCPSADGLLINYMALGQNQVPLVNIPKMNRIVFMGMFTYPFLVIIGIDPPPLPSGWSGVPSRLPNSRGQHPAACHVQGLM